MRVTNTTTSDIYFGPLHLDGGVGAYLDVDDTTATSLYLTNDAVADALNNAYLSGQVTVSGQAEPFPRPTGDPAILHGSGDPEGLVYATQGSIYLRRDGLQSNGGVIYMKTSGVTSSKGWIDIATASGATAALPSGAVAAFAGTSAPEGWLLCDGSPVSRSLYSLLFAAIGTAYGAGDGSTTFNLPDLRGRVAVGVGTNSDVAALGNSDGLGLASRSPQHNSSLSGSPGLTGSPSLTGSPTLSGAPSLTGSPSLTGAPGISDSGHGHSNSPRGWKQTSGGSGTGSLAVAGTGNAAYDTNIVANNTTGITATIGTLAAGIGTLAAGIGSLAAGSGTLAATIGSLAATIGSLSSGPGGTRPTDTPAFQTVNYIIKT